ncbi:MAG: undecaprenyldiphospho-muramoylpentapeptide beta-N-acetylglucosaminyltransferase [Patescibacteria group bacterium]
MRILLTGGGTMGSVSPLLAIVEETKLQNIQADFLWLGTKLGPENKIVGEYGLPFIAVHGGKLRRYFSWQNFLDPLRIVAGFFQGLNIIYKFKPDIIISAGAFISVPIVFAGWLLRVPILVHQQDIIPGLANKLMMPYAKKITVAFEQSLKDYPKDKVSWLGNPIRQSIFQSNRTAALAKFNLTADLPVLLVLGGGTGALALNQLVADNLNELVSFCQVIHITGSGKALAVSDTPAVASRYHPYEFLTTDLALAYAAADLVVSRAGLSTLTELANLGKPTILIPIENSHQEANANYFARYNAVEVAAQSSLDGQKFVDLVQGLINNLAQLHSLTRNIKTLMKTGAAKAVVDLILSLTKKP